MIVAMAWSKCDDVRVWQFTPFGLAKFVVVIKACQWVFSCSPKITLNGRFIFRTIFLSVSLEIVRLRCFIVWRWWLCRANVWFIICVFFIFLKLEERSLNSFDWSNFFFHLKILISISSLATQAIFCFVIFKASTCFYNLRVAFNTFRWPVFSNFWAKFIWSEINPSTYFRAQPVAW